MTNISKSHQIFSNRLNNPRVLEYPQEFLGPNYEAVLDFWLFLDELTEDQSEMINGRYWDFYNNPWSEWDKAADEAFEASEETIGQRFAEEAEEAAYNAYVTSDAYVAYYATSELIGMHLLLDQQKSLTFFNMFLDL